MKLETRSDLQRLVDDGLEESLGLEELCKDVSAMANSSGGLIIYGIKEDKITRKPREVDGGVDDPKVTKEWIEQILLSRVQPRMNCVRIGRIDMENGKFGYALTIDQSHTAHQAPNRKYYKRFELQSVSMHDYEIRDVMRRATTPDLHIELSFETGVGVIHFAPPLWGLKAVHNTRHAGQSFSGAGVPCLHAHWR
jgi:predicted HTH transcriptional regulator